MPTLASIHSSQATICIEVQPSQPGFLGKTLGTDTISGMVLDHSRVHLLMCPESGALCQASKALCGSRKRPREWGMRLDLNFFTILQCPGVQWLLLSTAAVLVGLTMHMCGDGAWSLVGAAAPCVFTLLPAQLLHIPDLVHFRPWTEQSLKCACSLCLLNSHKSPACCCCNLCKTAYNVLQAKCSTTKRQHPPEYTGIW